MKKNSQVDQKAREAILALGREKLAQVIGGGASADSIAVGISGNG